MIEGAVKMENLWIAHRARKRFESACSVNALHSARYLPAEKPAQLKQ